jgi:hypothetical protein
LRALTIIILAAGAALFLIWIWEVIARRNRP